MTFSGRVEERWAGEGHSGGTEVSEEATAVAEAERSGLEPGWHQNQGRKKRWPEIFWMWNQKVIR